MKKEIINPKTEMELKKIIIMELLRLTKDFTISKRIVKRIPLHFFIQLHYNL